MWSFKFFASLAVPITLLATPAAADTLSLQSKSEWKLREYEDKCRISRNFGSNEDQVTLWIDKGGPGAGVNVTLIGRPLRHPFGPFVSIGFAPEASAERAYITLKSSKGRPVLTMFCVEPTPTDKAPGGDSEQDTSEDGETIDLPQGTLSDNPTKVDFADRYNAIRSLELSGAVIEPISLDLEGFAAMMDGLAQCTNSLSAKLAGNTSSSAVSGSPAVPTGQAEWARKIQANYPFHLLRKGEEGSVAVRLTINRAGRAGYCEVVAYSGPPSFNDTACLQLLRHARFSPAKGGDGEAVPAFYSTRITYRLNK